MRHLRVITPVCLAAAAIAVALSQLSCEKKSDGLSRVVVIGMDGLDPRLCERLMDQGALPHLAALRDKGGYKPLGTTTPPQSPVAWASFITGANPGVHGIFDFIHRDPSKQYAPYYAAAETVDGEGGWAVGEHEIPITLWPFQHTPTQTLLRRHGTPFWDYLDEAGVPTWFYDIPANYPPSPSKHGHLCCLSGMGVPDLLGSYGTYQLFSEDTYVEKRDEGGLRKPLIFKDDRAGGVLTGPKNTSLVKPVDTHVGFDIYRHPTEQTARIEVQGKTIVLKAGEWSDWCKVSFTMKMPSFLPSVHVSGICRFYLQEVRPNFRLYVTPLNIDPSDPGDQRITEPAAFVGKLSDALGLFYTTGFQEDHKALSAGTFVDEEYREQADYVLSERLELLDYAIENYDDGLLFFYFSSTDLQAHMFWWDGDEPHPTRSRQSAAKCHGTIEALYKRMDDIVGDVLERFGDDATILVMSDHGFCNFRRQFSLNAWLRNNGYIHPPECESLLLDRTNPVDWSRTQAYGLGINGLYLNLKGRERDGSVDPAQRDRVLDELTEKLLAVRDPVSGEPVVARVDRADRIYSGPSASVAPDLIVGYHRGYRASWATALGDMSEEEMTDNDSAWSADHCVAAELVPGVIFSNRPVLRASPSLIDLAPTILQEFGVEPPETMVGGSLFETEAVTTRD